MPSTATSSKLLRRSVASSKHSVHNQKGEQEASTPFLLSRPNLVGVIVAVLIVIIHVTVGLGALWPLVAVCGWGASVLLVPAPAQKQLPPAPAVPTQVQLEQTLEATLRKLEAAEVPDKVAAKADELRTAVKFVLFHWDDLEDEPNHQLTMSDVVQVYFPQVVNDYADVPNVLHPDAVASVVSALDSLIDAVSRIRTAIVQDSLDTLSSNAQLLRDRFATNPLGPFTSEGGDSPGTVSS